MPDWLSQGFVLAMMIGVPAVLAIGAAIAFWRYKKQDEMWDNVDELDEETLDAMAEENKESEDDADLDDIDLDEEDAEKDKAS